MGKMDPHDHAPELVPQSGLEVVPKADAPESEGRISTPIPQGAEERDSRICGVKASIFWTVMILIVIILAAGIGAGIGGGLASQRKGAAS